MLLKEIIDLPLQSDHFVCAADRQSSKPGQFIVLFLVVLFIDLRFDAFAVVVGAGKVYMAVGVGGVGGVGVGLQLICCPRSVLVATKCPQRLLYLPGRKQSFRRFI